MALTDIDFNTTFDYEPTTKVFKFEDTVDYSGQSVAIANATGVIKVVAPSGTTIYNNTNHGSPDIDPSVSRFNTTTIPLPLMGDGTVMQGSYQFTYTVRVVNNTLSSNYDVALTKTFTLNYSSPSVSIGNEVDCMLPLLTVTDETSYTVNYVTPTITRAFTLYYPSAVQVAPITGTANQITTSQVYVVSGTPLQYSSSLTSNLVYSLGSGFYIEDEITATTYFDVACDNDLCDVYCALRSQYRRWQDSKGSVQVEQAEKNKFALMMSIASLMGNAIKCNRTADISGYVTQLKAIGNFDDCSCSDSDTPTLVTGLGSANTVVVAAGNGITVATATGGGVTTYTISLTSALLTKLNNAYNTVVSAGAGISIAVATASDGTKTYTVTNTQTQPNMVDSIKTIALASGSLPVIAGESAKTYGTTLQDVTLTANYNGSVSSWQNNPAFFTVSGFFVGASAAFYPEVDIIYSLKTGFSFIPYARPYVVEIITYSSTTFQFRLTDRTTGQAITGSTLDAQYSDLKILIKILS